MLEAVQSTVWGAAGRFLHGRLADVFERQGAPALLLALHWMEAGREDLVLPHLLASAQADEVLLMPEEATNHYTLRGFPQGGRAA